MGMSRGSGVFGTNWTTGYASYQDRLVTQDRVWPGLQGRARVCDEQAVIHKVWQRSTVTCY